MTQRNTEQGFTIIELAVVIMVIALIIGGITTGRNLVDSAKVRAVVAEVEGYQTALDAFLTKYQSLPGDMPDAASYWTTTNGNGNEQISYSENADAWQQLEQAGFISAGGLNGDNGTKANIGVNVPASSIAGAGYYFDYDAATVGNFIALGGEQAAGANNKEMVKPGMAISMDKKLDDGMPEQGRVRATGGGDCINSSEYNLGDATAATGQCTMYFQLNTSL